MLGEQLSPSNPVLDGADRVVLVESRAAMGFRRYHRQKLHHVLSAMRHFAEDLRGRGVEVEVVSAPTFAEGIAGHVGRHSPKEVRLLEPTSLGAGTRFARLPSVRVVPGSLFLTPPEAFREWADGRSRLVMEDFYRWQRRRLGILMDGEQPAGGRWNYDVDNRRPPPDDRRPPSAYSPREDEIDRAVRRDLDALALEAFGEDGPRTFAATRAEADAALEAFLASGLPEFGPWQDAMLAGERRMWHSGLAAPMNLGLIDPLQCVRAVEREYREGRAPIGSAEGFIRQVIGWREFVHGVYRVLDWDGQNALDARARLPEALWSGRTRMACVGDVVAGVRREGYAHHIERLMVLGNLLLILGVDPDEALEWFTAAFVDAHEWVMAPNVLGMALYADGGRMSTKPYAAGGRYVSRMSDHCRACVYRPTLRLGPDACPLSTLYWDFLARNEDALRENHRMGRVLGGLGRIPSAEMRQIRDRAARLRERLDAG